MYNVEKYVERCLVSCINQENVTNDDYEIIIVNDGTKDNSLQIAERTVAGLSNVTIVSQENAGLSAARNKGLSLAKGNYVWFVDSDDWISKDAVRTIMNSIETTPDVIMIRSANCYGENIKVRQEERIEGQFTGIHILNNYNWDPCSPFYIYNRQFLLNNNLEFYVGIFHEDNEYTPRLLFFAQKVTTINDIMYFVYQNPCSITRTVNPKRAFDLIIVAKSLYDFVNKHSISNKTQKSFNKFISTTLNTAISQYMLMNKDNSTKFLEILKEEKSMLATTMLGSTKFKHKVQGILISMLPILVYLKIHRLILK